VTLVARVTESPAAVMGRVTHNPGGAGPVWVSVTARVDWNGGIPSLGLRLTIRSGEGFSTTRWTEAVKSPTGSRATVKTATPGRADAQGEALPKALVSADVGNRPHRAELAIHIIGHAGGRGDLVNRGDGGERQVEVALTGRHEPLGQRDGQVAAQLGRGAVTLTHGVVDQIVEHLRLGVGETPFDG
jgi:hypothetical protein